LNDIRRSFRANEKKKELAAKKARQVAKMASKAKPTRNKKRGTAAEVGGSPETGRGAAGPAGRAGKDRGPARTPHAQGEGRKVRSAEAPQENDR
jgi:hypothetical protein